ncbi:MAG: tetratricopeptide repeat protein, partial [Gemmatimonadetes bacterium]|nr:tetratricopeptide repeat protein [Gemmatimonadota bacterium]
LLERAADIFAELGIYRAGHLGWLYLKRGDLAAAEDFFRDTLAQDEDSSWFAITEFDCYLGLAEVARARGDEAAAREELERAIRAGEKAWPGGHPHLQEARAQRD